MLISSLFVKLWLSIPNRKLSTKFLINFHSSFVQSDWKGIFWLLLLLLCVNIQKKKIVTSCRHKIIANITMVQKQKQRSKLWTEESGDSVVVILISTRCIICYIAPRAMHFCDDNDGKYVDSMFAFGFFMFFFTLSDKSIPLKIDDEKWRSSASAIWSTIW